MNHPHIKGGGTLFMGVHIHKDLVPAPGLKFTDLKSSETKEKPRLFKERKLSVQDYLSLKNKQSAGGLGG